MPPIRDRLGELRIESRGRDVRAGPCRQFEDRRVRLPVGDARRRPSRGATGSSPPSKARPAWSAARQVRALRAPREPGQCTPLDRQPFRHVAASVQTATILDKPLVGLHFAPSGSQRTPSLSRAATRARPRGQSRQAWTAHCVRQRPNCLRIARIGAAAVDAVGIPSASCSDPRSTVRAAGENCASTGLDGSTGARSPPHAPPVRSPGSF